MSLNTAINIVASRVVDYFSTTGEANSQIPHTIAVVGYTRQIAFRQQLDQRKQQLLEMAAWLHDIGCPESRKTFGDTLPVHQMSIGERIVNEWFTTDVDYPNWKNVTEAISMEEQQWIAQVVGTHHQKPKAEALHYEPLFEADMIVNVYENHLEREKAEHHYEHLLFSDEGRMLFRRIIWNEE